MILIEPYQGTSVAQNTGWSEHAMGKVNRVVATLDADGVQRIEVIGGDYRECHDRDRGVSLRQRSLTTSFPLFPH